MNGTNGNGNGNLLREILAKGGVNTLILCVAGWWMATEVIAPLKNKHVELIDHLKATTNKHGEYLEQQAHTLESIEHLQEQTCSLLKESLRQGN